MARLKGRLADQINPAKPLADFEVSDAVEEMKAALADAGDFTGRMSKAEKTRQCDRPGKNGTGRKLDTAREAAKPWHGAADHDVWLTQWLLKLRIAMRLAAIQRGSFSVRPMEGTDAKRAQALRLVMQYYMNGAMGTMIPVHGSRAGAWSDRWGHSILYVSWKQEKAVERRTITRRQLIDLATRLNIDETGLAGNPEVEQIVASRTEADFSDLVLSKAGEDRIADLVLMFDAGLKDRGAEGKKEALRVVREMRAGADSVRYVTSFIKANHPQWESLIPFVDVFYPAETVVEDNLDSARWIARTKWLSVQQLREQAAIHGWNPAWVMKVSQKKGRQSIFGAAKTSWLMSGAGVGWTVQTGRITGETERNLVQITELWDRASTLDGLRGTYHTVFHADVKDLVAKRELLEHWGGEYPFIPFTHEMDERMLLGCRGVPHFTASPQQAIEAQHNSRTDAASLATVPPWTGPPELKGTKIKPGAYIEEWRAGSVKAFQLPPPDNRSVEIEKTIRAGVNQLYGVPSNDVPDAVSMLMGQADMDWFLMSFSQALKLTAKLVQQFMPTLTGARITGTDTVFNASPDDVRGSFDFLMKFDVRSLDVEWTREILTFIKDLLVPLDRRGQIKTGPLLEFGFSVLDPALAMASVMPDDAAQQQTEQRARQNMDSIFSGGSGEEPSEKNEDYAGLARAMMQEFVKSPMRQNLVASVPQIRTVFISRMRQLIDLDRQYGENAEIGRAQGGDPLQPPNEIEQFLNQLEAQYPTPRA